MKNIIYLFLISALTNVLHITQSQSSANTFAIYILKDSTIFPGVALSQPIDSLILSDTPFLTASDLAAYGKLTHSFVLTPEMDLKYKEMGKLRGKSLGLPFVVTVGNERIYVGTFWWPYSSMMPPNCAFIDVFGSTPHNIELGKDAVDKRSDSRIYHALRNAGILIE